MITKKVKDLLLVRMIDGEDLFSNLEKIVKKYKLKSGIVVSCLGMLRDVELGYLVYPKGKGNYIFKKFEGPFEIDSFNGDFGFFGNKLVSHIHVALSGKDYICIGGHLNKAKVNATVELFILESDSKFVRKLDKKTGLKLLNFK